MHVLCLCLHVYMCTCFFIYTCIQKLQNGNMQYVAMSRKVVVSIENHLQLLGPDEFYACKVVTWEKPTKDDLESTATKWIQFCIDLTGGAVCVYLCRCVSVCLPVCLSVCVWACFLVADLY